MIFFPFPWIFTKILSTQLSDEEVNVWLNYCWTSSGNMKGSKNSICWWLTKRMQRMLSSKSKVVCCWLWETTNTLFTKFWRPMMFSISWSFPEVSSCFISWWRCPHVTRIAMNLTCTLRDWSNCCRRHTFFCPKTSLLLIWFLVYSGSFHSLNGLLPSFIISILQDRNRKRKPKKRFKMRCLPNSSHVNLPSKFCRNWASHRVSSYNEITIIMFPLILDPSTSFKRKWYPF